MSKFKAHIEQDNRVVSLWFSGKLPDIDRNSIFKASNGAYVLFANLPSITLYGDVFIPDSNSGANNYIAKVECKSFIAATVLYNKVVKAIVEWSSNIGRTSMSNEDAIEIIRHWVDLLLVESDPNFAYRLIKDRDAIIDLLEEEV